MYYCIKTLLFNSTSREYRNLNVCTFLCVQMLYDKKNIYKIREKKKKLFDLPFLCYLLIFESIYFDILKIICDIIHTARAHSNKICSNLVPQQNVMSPCDTYYSLYLWIGRFIYCSRKSKYLHCNKMPCIRPFIISLAFASSSSYCCFSFISRRTWEFVDCIIE